MKKFYDLLKGQTDQRLLRLFAVGCCRQIWDKLTDERSRTAVEVAERFADGQATSEELKKACDVACDAVNNNAANAAAWVATNYAVLTAAYFADRAAYDAAYGSVYNAAYYAAHDTAFYASHDTADIAAYNAAIERQLELYHCLFTKIVFTTTNPNAMNLAKIIYKEHNWILMPILGDALEEAGATAEVISHCKEKEHARGCWVVDNILRKI